MFNKKECKRCKKKLDKNYDFCPYCGISIRSRSPDENWGMLGKDDFFDEFEDFSKSMFGNGNMLNSMIGTAMKMLEQEIQREMKEQNSKPKSNFQLYINGKKVNLDGSNGKEVKLQKTNKSKKQFYSTHLSPNNLKKFPSLSKEEPKTNIRRLSNKVIYEINMPGVKSMDDISIIQLEGSIEIKALAKDKAYYKIIPISLPIMNSNLERENLVLELEAKD